MNSIKSMAVSLLPPKAIMHLQAVDHYFNGEQEIRLLRRLVDRKRRAIDAGANIGTYSYFLRKYASEVHAYEPNPALASRLGALLPTIKVHPVALSDRSGELTFTVPISESGRPQHELGSVSQFFDGEVLSQIVQCVTIDSQAIDDVGFIKIDVEQHEREVLHGALQTIEESRPTILVEVYPLKYERSLRDEFAFILKKNYCAWFYFAGSWRPLSSFDPNVHAAPEYFGRPERFMGNNILLFPIEHPRAGTGPIRSH